MRTKAQSRHQWIGFVLGLVGVSLVVWQKRIFGVGSVVGVSSPGVTPLATLRTPLWGVSISPGGAVDGSRWCNHRSTRRAMTRRLTFMPLPMQERAFSEDSRKQCGRALLPCPLTKEHFLRLFAQLLS